MGRLNQWIGEWSGSRAPGEYPVSRSTVVILTLFVWVLDLPQLPFSPPIIRGETFGPLSHPPPPHPLHHHPPPHHSSIYAVLHCLRRNVTHSSPSVYDSPLNSAPGLASPAPRRPNNGRLSPLHSPQRGRGECLLCAISKPPSSRVFHFVPPVPSATHPLPPHRRRRPKSAPLQW